MVDNSFINVVFCCLRGFFGIVWFWIGGNGCWVGMGVFWLVFVRFEFWFVLFLKNLWNWLEKVDWGVDCDGLGFFWGFFVLIK